MNTQTIQISGWNSDTYSDSNIIIHAHDSDHYNHTYGIVVLAIRNISVGNVPYSANSTIVDITCTSGGNTRSFLVTG